MHKVRQVYQRYNISYGDDLPKEITKQEAAQYLKWDINDSRLHTAYTQVYYLDKSGKIRSKQELRELKNVVYTLCKEWEYGYYEDQGWNYYIEIKGDIVFTEDDIKINEAKKKKDKEKQRKQQESARARKLKELKKLIKDDPSLLDELKGK